MNMYDMMMVSLIGSLIVVYNYTTIVERIINKNKKPNNRSVDWWTSFGLIFLFTFATFIMVSSIWHIIKLAFI